MPSPAVTRWLNNSLGGLILFGIAVCSLSGIGLWVFNSVTDQYPTGFAGGWYAIIGALWGVVTYRHYLQKVSDAPALPGAFVGAFGCYYVSCAICMFASFVALASSDAVGTSMWPAICTALIVILMIIWCRKEVKRHEFDDFDAPDDSACTGVPLNVALLAGSAIVLFFHTLLAAQAVGSAVDLLSLSPPGRVFQVADVGNEELAPMHIHCLESGEKNGLPTVIFESAINAPGVGWTEVQRRVALVTQACYYDRKGYGWSWRGINPRHVNRFAVELNDLMREAEIPRPVIYVGWGFGSFAALAYAAQFGFDTTRGNYTGASTRAEVAGMVLVDGLHRDSPGQAAEAGEAVFVDDTFGLGDGGDSGPTSYDLMQRFLIPLGFTRMGQQASLETGALGFPFATLKNFPAAAFEQFRAFLLGYYHSNVVVQEKREWHKQSLADIAPLFQDGSLGELPLTVIARKDGSTEYQAVQQKLAAMSNAPGLLVESNATDYLPFRDPDFIADRVVDVLAQALVKYYGGTLGKRDQRTRDHAQLYQELRAKMNV